MVKSIAASKFSHTVSIGWWDHEAFQLRGFKDSYRQNFKHLLPPFLFSASFLAAIHARLHHYTTTGVVELECSRFIGSCSSFYLTEWGWAGRRGRTTHSSSRSNPSISWTWTSRQRDLRRGMWVISHRIKSNLISPLVSNKKHTQCISIKSIFNHFEKCTFANSWYGKFSKWDLISTQRFIPIISKVKDGIWAH